MSNIASKTREYQQCSNCIMDTTDPLIQFDEFGVCNHCNYYRNYEKDRLKIGEEGKKITEQMVAEIKAEGKKKDYDCIMGISGGVDSSYLAYYASEVLGLRILVVHIDSGWNSELAVNNIENIISKLKLDLHTLVLDWEEMRDLQRAFYRSSVPNCDIPQDHAFISALFTEAKKFKLHHILNGGNMATESILPISWGYDAADWIHIKDIHRKFGEKDLKTFPRITYFQKKIKYPYLYKLKVHRPLEYIEYNKSQVKEFLKKEFDWRDYGGKHYESKFTHFFQAYYLPTKYGYDKRLAHLSSLVVSGQMTKQEALQEISIPLYDPKELAGDIDFITKKLGFSKEEWDQIMKAEPKTEDDYKNEKKLNRRFLLVQRIINSLYSKIFRNRFVRLVFKKKS